MPPGPVGWGSRAIITLSAVRPKCGRTDPPRGTVAVICRPRAWGRVLTAGFLVALGLLWIAVMVPAILRARAGAPLTTAQRFRRRMDLIAPPSYATGRWVVVPYSSHRKASSPLATAYRQARTQRRRRRLLFLILLAVIGSGVAGWLRGEPWWEVHIGLNAALALYVGTLLEIKRRREERAIKVHPIKSKRPTDLDFADVDEMYGAATAAGRR